MRKWLLIFWLGIIAAAIVLLFWHNEWKYNLPTPIPKNYHAVKRGEAVNLPSNFVAQIIYPLLFISSIQIALAHDLIFRIFNRW
jgi:hypothetical protein